MSPIVKSVLTELLPILVSLVSTIVIPKAKRKAFEKMTEGLQDFGSFILEQKEKVEESETELDNGAYKLSKEAFKKFLDEANKLYEKM